MPATARGGPKAPGRLPARFFLLGTTLCASACASLGQGGSPTALMKASGTQATASEIRAATRSLSLRVPGIIEESGDRMLGMTLDPDLRRAALRWKLDGTAAFHLTLFRPDPLEAVLETWALAIQIEDWVDSERVRKGFGSLQPVAAEGAHAVREAVEKAATRTARRSEGAQKMKELIEAWAHAHPIEGTFATRPTAEPVLARIGSSEDVGLVEAFGQVTSSLDDLTTKVDLYAASLPKAATWQVELAMLDVTQSDTGKLLLATLQSAHGVLGRTDALLGGTTGHELQKSLRGERVAVLGDLDRQRLDLLDRLKGEREAVLQNVDVQRVATLADLDRKLDRSLQGADGLRQRAMGDLEPMVTRIGLRFGLLVTALMCFAALLTWLLLRSRAARFYARRDGQP